MLNKISILLFVLISKSAFAYAPPDVPILSCGGATLTEHSYGDHPQNNIYLHLTNPAVNQYLLTRNTGQVINGDYFGMPNSPNNGQPNNGAGVTLIQASSYSDQAVSSGNDYSGSLASVSNDKQIRILYSRQTQELTVSLFNTSTNTEDANWIFRGCQSTGN
jgi:hypothetical protein